MRLLALMLVPLLSSCQRSVETKAEDLSGGRLLIETSAGWWEHRCVSHLSLSRVTAEARVTVWTIAVSSGSWVCHSRSIYPDVPNGYRVVERNEAEIELREGEEYFVDVSGSAYDSGARGTIDANRTWLSQPLQGPEE